MTFKPGQTGNPGGRTVAQREREKSFAEAIRGLAGPDGLDYVRELDAMARDRADPKLQLMAIKELHDRGWGKAPETIQVEGQVVDARMLALVEAARMTPHERRKLLESPEPDGDDDDKLNIEGPGFSR